MAALSHRPSTQKVARWARDRLRHRVQLVRLCPRGPGTVFPAFRGVRRAGLLVLDRIQRLRTSQAYPLRSISGTCFPQAGRRISTPTDSGDAGSMAGSAEERGMAALNGAAWTTKVGGGTGASTAAAPSAKHRQRHERGTGVSMCISVGGGCSEVLRVPAGTFKKGASWLKSRSGKVGSHDGGRTPPPSDHLTPRQ